LSRFRGTIFGLSPSKIARVSSQAQVLIATAQLIVSLQALCDV
jgi:hypothetical protein